MTPAARKSPPLSSPCASTMSAVPASDFESSRPMPTSIAPAWLIVEYASSRFMCDCRKAITAPTTAVIRPAAISTLRIAIWCEPNGASKIVQ
jgi:hypothetical protein